MRIRGSVLAPLLIVGLASRTFVAGGTGAHLRESHDAEAFTRDHRVREDAESGPDDDDHIHGTDDARRAGAM